MNDSYQCLKVVLELAKSQLAARSPSRSTELMTNWINLKDNPDGFIALHFASFKGNPDACELLVEAGADMNAKNNFGINMLHVAA